MNPQKPSDPEASPTPEEHVERNPEVEEFFQKLMEKQDIRRPKPSPEALTAALQAIQRLGARIEAEQGAEGSGEAGGGDGVAVCPACGYQNLNGNKFCGMCAAPLGGEGAELKPRGAPGAQHHFHHHYHHFLAGEEAGVLAGLGQRLPGTSGSAGSAPPGSKLRTTVGGPGLSRAEANIRQMTHDWAAACNNKQIEDLLEFYAADALVMRPNVPPIRGTAAIREFFVGALEAGFGDVELEALRVEVLGDVAYQAGRCKMLVPVVVGKRREERGKYVMIFAKEKGGQWKAVVDCLSADLGLNVAEPLAGTPPTLPPKPRR